MNRDLIRKDEDKFGKALLDSFAKAYPDGCKRGAVMVNPEKMVEFERLHNILCEFADKIGATVETDMMQQSETSAYIFIRAKEIQINFTDLFMKAVAICPVMEISSRTVNGGEVEISFAVNRFAKRI